VNVDADAARAGTTSELRVLALDDGTARARYDAVATEEPLEIRVVAGGTSRTAAITMRTPGADFELAAGFLYGEGLVASRAALRGISYCVSGAQRYNVVNVALAADTLPEMATLERHFLTTSACGVCGKANLEALRLRGAPPLSRGPALTPALIASLPERLRAAQGIFQSTGGLHAAALFESTGRLLALREDVGRHNALDKLVGWALLGGRLPLHDRIVMVSGRASFELLQKSLAAGASTLCAISAPSSLAVAVAREFGMTLIGLIRGARFNVYAGEERIVSAMPAERTATSPG
jgi:FdhD protein